MVRDVTRDRSSPPKGIPVPFPSLALTVARASCLDLATMLRPFVDSQVFVEEPGFEEGLNEGGCIAGELSTSGDFFRAEFGQIPRGGIVQGPEPKEGEVSSGLGAWDAEA